MLAGMHVSARPFIDDQDGDDFVPRTESNAGADN